MGVPGVIGESRWMSSGPERLLGIVLLSERLRLSWMARWVR